MLEEGLWKTLESLLRRYGIADKFREQLIVVEWGTEAPPMARRARPLYVRDKILYLSVPSHAFAQELDMQKSRIIRDLQERGYDIRDLKFIVMPMEPTANVEELEIRVTADDETWARKALEGQKLPPRLRQRMVALLAATRARERAMLAVGARICRTCGAAFFGEGDICPVCHVEELEAVSREDDAG